MFYYKIQWFYQDVKNENLCFFKNLSSRNENTGPVTRDLSSQMSNEKPLKLKNFSFMLKQV